MTAPLVYIVGASGSGKDSLMQYCRTRLSDQHTIQFMHRYITRAAHAGGENHVQLSPQEFAARRQMGLFAMDWSSHGHDYGIGIEIDAWLERGIAVVLNGSREYLSEARRRYPTLLEIRIEVSAEVLRQRLHERGRESTALIDARLARHRCMDNMPHDGFVIANDGALADAGEALVSVIQQAGLVSCT